MSGNNPKTWSPWRCENEHGADFQRIDAVADQLVAARLARIHEIILLVDVDRLGRRMPARGGLLAEEEPNMVTLKLSPQQKPFASRRRDAPRRCRRDGLTVVGIADVAGGEDPSTLVFDVPGSTFDISFGVERQLFAEKLRVGVVADGQEESRRCRSSPPCRRSCAAGLP